MDKETTMTKVRGIEDGKQVTKFVPNTTLVLCSPMSTGISDDDYDDEDDNILEMDEETTLFFFLEKKSIIILIFDPQYPYFVCITNNVKEKIHHQ